MSESSGTIQNVSDTAIWVAMYRAQESERRDALFHDPYARRLAGERGEKILDTMPQGRRMSWPMVVRTSVLDDYVMRTVRDEGADAVLDLATGLDARPWRLDLPTSLRWVDVDLPEILDYKQRTLANDRPHCRYEARACDLRDDAGRRVLFADVGSTSTKVLVITEGLLVYLTRESVEALARDLAAQPAFRWWIFDLLSPELLKRLQGTWGGGLDKAPLVFAPAEGTKFFEPLGWKEREFRSTWLDAKRLKRSMPGAWIYDLVMAISPRDKREAVLRYSGNVMLVPADR